ncbi:hypothetical protein PHYSODRAFT_409709, partial [Phytophthora sojae]
FWGTFGWSDNPWLTAPSGFLLRGRRFSRIRDGTLDQLEPRKEGEGRFWFSVAQKSNEGRRHRHRTMCKWAIIVILLSQRDWQEGRLYPPFKLRHLPQWLRNVSWRLRPTGHLSGAATSQGTASWQLNCRQLPNGINWEIEV